MHFDIMRRIMENYFDVNVVQVMNITGEYTILIGVCYSENRIRKQPLSIFFLSQILMIRSSTEHYSRYIKIYT